MSATGACTVERHPGCHILHEAVDGITDQALLEARRTSAIVRRPEIVRLVIHDYGGYPFTVQLARSLSLRGHEVLYLHSAGLVTPKGKMEPQPGDPPSLLIDSVEIGDGRGSRGVGPRRFLQERQYGAAVGSRIRSHDADVVLSANTPLDAQAIAIEQAHANGSAFVFWMQDLYSRAVANLLGRRIPVAGWLAGARYSRLERRLLLASDAVVLASKSFMPTVMHWRVPSDRVSVISNWSPLDPELDRTPRDNPWSREHGLSNVPVLAYTGTLGRKHNPEMLTALAEAIPEARILVVSEGVGATWLRERAHLHSNMIVLPLQPAARLTEVLRTADLLIALLEHDASEFSEPSKVLTYLTAGRPILAAIPATNQAAMTIREAGAGVAVDPADTAGFIAAARDLLGDGDARTRAGERGAAYARARFAIETITDQFERVLLAGRSRWSAALAASG